MDKLKKTALKEVETISEELWEYLLQEMAEPYWKELKRHRNKLLDIKQKLIRNGIHNDMDLIQDSQNRAREARKVLDRVKSDRAKNKYKRVPVDSKTYKEVLIKNQ